MSILLVAQDLSEGLLVNDLELRPMQPIAKPAYLETITDPSLGTTIRRITDAGSGNVIVPMYSTIQPWNANESLLILYNQTNSVHQLLDGQTYEFIRNLNDFWPVDIEQIFWDFNDPDIFYYPDSENFDFVRYEVSTQTQTVLFNMDAVTSNCSGFFSSGNDVQMMSWDSDVVGFRCGNSATYYYRISTQELITFNTLTMDETAAMPAPSGNLFCDFNLYAPNASLIGVGVVRY